MSTENVQKFYEAVASDEGLRLKLTELSQSHGKEEMNASKVESLLEKEILPLAAQMGWEFSLADLQRYAEELQPSQLQEDLSEDELAAVSGGKGICLLIGDNYHDGNPGDCGCIVVGHGDSSNEKGLCIGWGHFH